MNTLPKFILGQRVRDIVTGFEGIATVRVEYINGCNQYLVKPRCEWKKDEPMKQPEGSYIDDQSLELVDQGICDPPAADINQAPAPTGGPDAREGHLPT
ncbi:MAG: hypothetical protein V3T23_07980 [Nitrososphaerales archaeon]